MKKFVSLIFLLSVLTFSLTSCKEEGHIASIQAVDRYRVTSVDNNFRLDYSYTDGRYEYYYLYLGKVDNVPISSEGAKYYNGQTTLKLSYSAKNVTEGNIVSSMSTCIARTTTISNSTQSLYSIEASIGTSDMSFIKAGVKIGYNLSWGSSGSTTNSTSTTETYQSFCGWASENTETVEFFIGENGEQKGYYRYTLFATCDVYVTLVRDLVNSENYYEHSTFARPNTYYTNIDYNDTNDFSIGVDTSKLNFDATLISSLTSPAEDLSSSTKWVRVSASNTTVGEIRVPAEIKELIVVGNNIQANMNIVVEDRNTPLKMTFSNARFTSSGNAIDASSMRGNKLTIELFGDNSVKAGNGNSGADGGRNNGSNGKTAIYAATTPIEFIGKGNTSITGGDGGKGGNGKNHNTYPNDCHGGNGGNGGDGIYCKSVSFQNATGDIIIAGGRGGNGGTGGNSTGVALGTGADGGNGGKGGDGGWSIVASEDPIQPKIKPVTITGCVGGIGGAGGKKNPGITINSHDGSKGADGTSRGNTVRII